MKHVIVFDFETNGFAGSSVLSITAIKYLFDKNDKGIYSYRKVGIFERFYYRNIGERLNAQAINVNGLTDNAISKYRRGCTYPKYFKDDEINFKKFCHDVNHYVAHNIDFDKKFLSFELPNKFCTMKSNTNIVRAGISRSGRYKWPKLKETAVFYKIKHNPNRFHDSKYDVEITTKVFNEMLNHCVAKDISRKFLEYD